MIKQNEEVDKSPKTTEVMAYRLMLLSWMHNTDNADPMERWQRDEVTRDDWRNVARNFIKQLGECGVKVAVRNTKELDAEIERLITIPARTAYKL